MQAELAARQAGVFMPVYFDQNAFRVVIRQPDGVYRRAWHLADEYEAEQEVARTPKFARSLAPEKRPAETRF